MRLVWLFRSADTHADRPLGPDDRELASNLGINGKAALVFGKEPVKGAISGAQMAQRVEAIREQR